MALLHDIGRTTGGPDVADVRHVLDGYRSMLERGFDDSARVCLTHSFPIKQADAFAGRWDCSGEEKQFVQDYLDRIEYTACQWPVGCRLIGKFGEGLPVKLDRE